MKDLSKILNMLTNEVGVHLDQALRLFESFFSGYSEAEKLFEIYFKHQDFDAVQRQAHQLKGTAANLRMAHISKLSEQIEAAAKAGDLDLCQDSVKEISKQINLLKSQMVEYKKIHKIKILIVEDNQASGQILEQIILNLGHTSLGIVSSPEQALLSVKSELPDLVFMDIELSAEMNGIYIAELLSGYHSIKVVFVSVHAEESVIKAANQYGIGYIIKPFTAKEIEKMIELAINSIVNSQSEDKKEQAKLRLKDDNKIFFIDFKDIIYFEARAHTILVCTDERTYSLNSSLKDIKEMDINDLFIQPHRGYLVNKGRISELIHENYNYQLKIDQSSTLIPVSQKNVKMVKALF